MNVQRDLSLIRSKIAAIKITEPIAVCCQKGFIPIRFKPFLIVTINRTPPAVPITVPIPPLRDAPPITIAAIASNKSSAPSVGFAAFNLELIITPANPAEAPLIKKEKNQHLFLVCQKTSKKNL